MHTYLKDVVGQGRLELIEQIALPDMVDEANQIFAGPTGRAGLVAHVKGFRRNIEDLRIDIHRVVAEDLEVMAWWSFSGKLVGPWLGIRLGLGSDRETYRENEGEEFSATVLSFFELGSSPSNPSMPGKTLEYLKISRYQLWLTANFEPPLVFDTRQGHRPLHPMVG